MTDQEVIKNIRGGNERAYQHVYKHRQMILFMVYKRGGNLQDGEDVFQNMLLVFIKKVNAPEFTLTCKLSSFLYKIADYTWMKYLTKKDSRVSYKEFLPDNGMAFQTHFDKENGQHLKGCIGQISPNEKRLIESFYFEQKSIPEIVEEFGYNCADTAKTIKYKALGKLRKVVKCKYTKEDFYYN